MGGTAKKSRLSLIPYIKNQREVWEKYKEKRWEKGWHVWGSKKDISPTGKCQQMFKCRFVQKKAMVMVGQLKAKGGGQGGDLKRVRKEECCRKGKGGGWKHWKTKRKGWKGEGEIMKYWDSDQQGGGGGPVKKLYRGGPYTKVEGVQGKEEWERGQGMTNGRGHSWKKGKVAGPQRKKDRRNR